MDRASASEALATLMGQFDAATAEAGAALEQADLDTLFGALERRESLLERIEPLVDALTGTMAATRALQLLRASEARTAELEVALSANYEYLRREMDRLDSVRSRSERYRGSEQAQGQTLDLTS